ncbi:MAG: hypothetical protein KDD38_06040 [Bdellovibrionales bacterium]|nr:hypothetical protein [Bdellovibrionales bacterium]
MNKLLGLTLSMIVSFYAGQSLAADGKPCPYNKGRHAKVDVKKQVLAALGTRPAPIKKGKSTAVE